MDNKNGDIHTREEIEDDLLVADYVAGKLDNEAREALEARIRDDDDLLARVIEERGFRSQPDDPGEGPDDEKEPAGAGDAEPADEPVKRASPWRRGAIAAVLIAAVLVVFYNQSTREVAPEPNAEIVPVLASNRVRIVFSNEASEADRSDVARELGVEIAFGPVEMNAYIGEADRILSREDLESWLDDPRVTLVEPVLIGGVP